MEEVDVKGLTDQEVLHSRLAHGANALDSRERHRFWRIGKDIVTEPLFVILVLTTIVYFVLGEFREGIIMLVALFFVSGISMYQENRSQGAVDALRKLSQPRARVVRNGVKQEIDSDELVLGDIFLLEDGDLVPADAMLVRANDFSVNESILTGESLAVFKDTSSTLNKIYRGTLVESGSCTARVTAVGETTAIGAIGLSLHEMEAVKTPLQQQIRAFVRKMVYAGIMAFMVVCGMNYFIEKDIWHALLSGLTLAMSVLPEEIPVAFSTFMALGAYHLYKKRVIARSPHTVETLGAATVICIDKTGTITENEMSLVAVYDATEGLLHDYTLEPFGYNLTLEYGMWASETRPFDKMEISIHQVYGEVAPEDKRSEYVMYREYPLGGQFPIMTHVFHSAAMGKVVASKGSVEGILKQCGLTEEEEGEILRKASGLAGKGYRVLGVAKADPPFEDFPESQEALKFRFLGLIAFHDAPKENIPAVLQEFYAAGINVKMITGDFPETALAIARQVKMRNPDQVMTGREVMELTPDELEKRVGGINVFARMFPEAKVKVIQALIATGEVVSMTGDGVNDGPALKAAHIGIAMGKRGSEVAKKAASLVLMDDDLAVMTDAIALGRRIYENLKKAIRYIISIHIPIILIVTLPLILLWKYTHLFSPLHVIFLELIMGPTCSIIYENEPIEAKSMERPPRKLSTSLFSWDELSLSILQGLVIALACLGIAYLFMMNGSDEIRVRTVVFSTLILSNIFLTLVNRSFYYSVFTTIRYKNRLVPLITMVSFILLLLSVYQPDIRNLFSFTELSLPDLGKCALTAFLAVSWVELWKFWKRRTTFALSKG
ncbi:MAG: cation-translocating P-type ATPase [Bacteroidia bacterium]|nr:cation-translocating P-type ATPase [Bacteroidia bacterium]